MAFFNRPGRVVESCTQRKSRRCARASVFALAFLAGASVANASLVLYTDRAAWEAAAGEVSTVGVPNIQPGQQRQQYISLGIDLGPAALFSSPVPSHWAESWGLSEGTTVFMGGSGSLFSSMYFSHPVTAFSFDWLFFQPQQLWVGVGQAVSGSITLPEDVPGVYIPTFYGIISTVPFRNLTIYPWCDQAICWGTSISFTAAPTPTPGAVALLGIAPLAFGRRRRM